MAKEYKAIYQYTRYENGIRYCWFAYRGRSYSVCYNAFYCYHTPAYQHRMEQDLIDADIERKERMDEYNKSHPATDWDEIFSIV